MARLQDFTNATRNGPPLADIATLGDEINADVQARPDDYCGHPGLVSLHGEKRL